jgi:hypothetical protein
MSTVINVVMASGDESGAMMVSDGQKSHDSLGGAGFDAVSLSARPSVLQIVLLYVFTCLRR